MLIGIMQRTRFFGHKCKQILGFANTSVNWNSVELTGKIENDRMILLVFNCIWVGSTPNSSNYLIKVI